VKVGDLIRFKMQYGAGGHSTAPWNGPALVIAPVDNPMGEPEWKVIYQGVCRVVNTDYMVVQYYDEEGVPHDLE